MLVCTCECVVFIVFFFKQKTAYEMRISDWSSDVCSSDLEEVVEAPWYEAQWVSPLVRNVSALLVALLLIFGIGHPLLKRRAAAQAAAAEQIAVQGQKIGREISTEIGRQATANPDGSTPITPIGSAHV